MAMNTGDLLNFHRKYTVNTDPRSYTHTHSMHCQNLFISIKWMNERWGGRINISSKLAWLAMYPFFLWKPTTSLTHKPGGMKKNPIHSWWNIHNISFMLWQGGGLGGDGPSPASSSLPWNLTQPGLCLHMHWPNFPQSYGLSKLDAKAMAKPCTEKKIRDLGHITP